MIIYSSAFVLSAAAAGAPLTNARILYNSLVRGLAASALTVSGETADGPKDAPLRPDTAEYWQPPALPATYVFDLGAAKDIDAFGLVGTFGSAGCAVTVATSTDGVAFTTFGSAISPADDAALLFLGDAVFARWGRVSITGGAVMPQLSVLYVGKALAMQAPVEGPYTPITMGRQTELHNAMSRGGQFLGQGFRRHGVVGDARFTYLDAAWVRANFDPFVKSARSLPYFFGWNPQHFPLEVGYCWAEKDIRPRYMGRSDFMEVAWDMAGVGTA